MDNSFNGARSATEVGAPRRRLSLIKTAEYVLLACIFLLPFFFIPAVAFPFQFGKVMLFTLGVLVSFSLYMIETLSKGRIKLPTGIILYASGAVILFVLLSSLTSGVLWRSIIGLGFEAETFVSILVFFFALFSSYAILKGKDKVLKVYSLLSVSAIIVFLFQILRVIFGPDFLSFGIFTSSISSILGRWNDIGIFFGLMALLTVLRLMYVKDDSKWLYYILLGMSLISLIVVNSLLVWLVVGIFALLVLVYDLVFSKKQDAETVSNKKNNKLPVIIIAFAIVFIFARGAVGNFVLNNLNINQIDVRPSWQSTFEIASSALKDNPAFGIGPNKFSELWSNQKSDEVNLTPFWNVDFNFGIGFIPTTISTEGILGFLSWVLLIVGILLLGLRALLAAGRARSLDRFVIMSSLLSTLFLWTFLVFYLPGTVMMTLSFVMLGLLLSVMADMKLLAEKEYNFSKENIAGFTSILAIVLVLFLNLALLYGVSTRYLSGVAFGKAIVSLNIDGDLEAGEKHSRSALSYGKTDRNYRLLSNIEILKLNQLVSASANLSEDETRAQFQNLLGNAIREAQASTQKDPRNYQNWISLGSIYEAIIPLGIEGAYENAINSYQKAIEENRKNPQLDLIIARTELAAGNAEKARGAISKSLVKKPNYTSAIFLLSQIEIQEGNITEAIQSVESATLIDPNDPVLFFQLGFLKYSEREFKDAITALERAVILNPPYSNAKYFLGLSYYAEGRSEEAVSEFEDLVVLNPGNREVEIILENMKEGVKDPLSGTEALNQGNLEGLPVNDEN